MSRLAFSVCSLALAASFFIACGSDDASGGGGGETFGPGGGGSNSDGGTPADPSEAGAPACSEVDKAVTLPPADGKSSGWQPLYNAKYGDGFVALVPKELSQRGQLVWVLGQRIYDLNVAFEVRVVSDATTPIADGFSFFVSKEPQLAEGTGLGPAFGFCGMKEGYGVGFRFFPPTDATLPSAELIVAGETTCETKAKSAAAIAPLKDGQFHKVEIAWAGDGAMSVKVDTAVVVSGNLHPLDGTLPYLGFGAGTGGARAGFDVRNVDVKLAVKETKCL